MGLSPESLSAPELFGALGALLAAARVGGAMAAWLRVPSVVGELIAGVALGALPFGWVARVRGDGAVGALGEFGVLLLLFEIGLETRAGELRRVGARAFAVASVGVVATVTLVGAVSALLSASATPAGNVFVGATLASTSIGIAARVLRDFGQGASPEGRVVLAAAVLDDVMGLLMLAAASALLAPTRHGAASAFALAAVAARACGFLAGAFAFGRLVLPTVFRALGRPARDGALPVWGLTVCLTYGFAASGAGLAPAIGAFVAGLALRPEDYRPIARHEGESLSEALGPVITVFVPIFFVLAGLQVDLAGFLRPHRLLLTLALLLAAASGKLLAGLGAGRGTRRLIVGLAMVPRGEVSLIFLAAASKAGDGASPLVPAATFGAVVTVIILTALAAPIALRRLLAAPAGAGGAI